jgi:hypothetical protein
LTRAPSPLSSQLLDESALSSKYGEKAGDADIGKTQRKELVKGVAKGDETGDRLDKAYSMVGAVTPGCQIGYMDHTGRDMDHTGCHQLVLLTIRPTRVVTPGCQIGYTDHTGCRQLVF